MPRKKAKPVTSLRVLGRSYAVFLADEKTLPDCVGAVDFEARRIYLRPHIDLKQTLLREIIEIANYELELNLSHPKIKALENFLFSVLSDNALTFHEPEK